MIVARYLPKDVTVQVNDVFECGGEQLATVEALAGAPFMGGDKWPVRTRYATVKAADLAPVTLAHPAYCETCGAVAPDLIEVPEYEDFQGSSWYQGAVEVEVCPTCGKRVERPLIFAPALFEQPSF